MIWLAKKVQYFGGTFWHMKVDVFILSFFARNDNISFGWNFVREEWKRSPGWIRQIAEEYSLYLKLELSIPLCKVAPNCWWVLEEFINWLDIADLFSFLISFALKKEEQESSLDFVIVMIREGLFSLEQRTKACFMSFRVSLTPATILRHAILENAKAFSVHETEFKHKIYR